MRHTPIFCVAGLLWIVPSLASAQEKDAKSVAQSLLDKGATLFDARDSAIMADTYTEDARLTWVEKNRDTGKYKFDVKEGRAEIEKAYRSIFKDQKEKTTSRNTVEFAKFITPDLMVIEGQFEPKVDHGKYWFTQERVKQGDRWRIQSLKIYIVFPE